MKQGEIRNKPLNKMLTVDDTASIFNVHPGTIRRWEKQGRLKSYRLGDQTCIRFRSEEIQDFINSARKF